MSASTKALLLAATASTSITAAWAQQPLGNDDDVITVTGSRIARSELESSQPILTVNTDDIQFSGDVNIIDVVNDLPALIGSLNGPRSVINGLGSGNNQNSLGSGALNLRNLGPDRTLVLVDGRRHVSGVAGTASVDVNTIPSALVEKVEVLTGGAAAVYGSDAVTGVVNFILKDDFEGFDGTAQFGFSDEGDGFNGFVSGTYGRNFDDDKGNVTVSVTFEQQDNIQARDRDFSRGDITASDLPNPARTIQSADVAAFGLDPLDLGRSIINSGEC
ncbi:MAG: TonB-dependent receptor plug domain-containing protein, partial [Pseudomonadota bacterium]